ncbi:phospholipase A2, membrane associated-like [Cavia porcellus]|uniref:phospholipase A2, membrane associated-like n=1 Tax=Cavia porcellus TaxID=10141 RepID=UPI00022B5934|nr:phospholipase A2, membrane associated-like [Cavia porcellus]
MNPLLLLAMVMASGLMCVLGDIWDFQKMIQLTTRKQPLITYGFYGCYCGLGGKGTPKDETDWCCARHDCCYQLLRKRGCGTKFLHYEFTLTGNKIECNANQDYCQAQVCECDKTAAYCFAETKKSYKKSYQFYLDLLCHGKGPTCENPLDSVTLKHSPESSPLMSLPPSIKLPEDKQPASSTSVPT